MIKNAFIAALAALSFAGLTVETPVSDVGTCGLTIVASGVGHLVGGYTEIADLGATQDSVYILQRRGVDGMTLAIEVNPGTDFFDANTWGPDDNGVFWWYRVGSCGTLPVVDPIGAM